MGLHLCRVESCPSALILPTAALVTCWVWSLQPVLLWEHPFMAVAFHTETHFMTQDAEKSW